ncbi:MAG: lysozyme inhibitor [Leptolyngbyaceae cyanobacterium SL_7_1]|nr:lysozyme inhibitor [Leptolyngbyaceae cyanobacterium SL_7_1]
MVTGFVGWVVVSVLPVNAQQSSVLYTCDQGRSFEVEYEAGAAQVTLPLEILALSQVVSASGARYSDGRTTLYTQGNEAFIEVDGQRTYSNCVIADDLLSPAPTPTPPPTPQPLSDSGLPLVVNYQCNYNRTFQATYFSESVELRFGAAPILILPPVESGSGTRYSDGRVTLSSQGDEALIEVGESIVYENCVAQETTTLAPTPAAPASAPAQPVPAPVPGLW